MRSRWLELGREKWTKSCTKAPLIPLDLPILAVLLEGLMATFWWVHAGNLDGGLDDNIMELYRDILLHLRGMLT